MINIQKLDKEVSAVAPIHGVSVGNANDKSTWRIDFKDEVTTQQKTDAQAALGAFVDGPDTDEERIDRAFPDTDVARVIFRVFVGFENRIRILEGRPTVSAAQVRDALKSMLS